MILKINVRKPAESIKNLQIPQIYAQFCSLFTLLFELLLNFNDKLVYVGFDAILVHV